MPTAMLTEYQTHKGPTGLSDDLLTVRYIISDYMVIQKNGHLFCFYSNRCDETVK